MMYVGEMDSGNFGCPRTALQACEKMSPYSQKNAVYEFQGKIVFVFQYQLLVSWDNWKIFEPYILLTQSIPWQGKSFFR